MAGKNPETVTVNHADSDRWGVFFRKAYRGVCDRSGNSRRRHDRERCRHWRARLSRLLRLEDRLSQGGYQAVPPSFRQTLELHQISSFSGVDEEAGSAITAWRLALHFPLRFLEKRLFRVLSG
jgi:hypothetical protein